MQKLKLSGLAILSGLLMGISWPATGNLGPLFFIALLPLLYIEYTVSQNPDKLKSRHLYLFALLTFITYNGFTTWWIYFASGPGMLMAVVLNSLFMAMVILWFHSVKKNFGNKKGCLTLVFFWIAFEWLHYHWEFSHPWATFGNTLANYTELIQWYEFTGALGGTLWFLVVNVLIFQLFKKTVILGKKIKNQTKSIYLILGIIIVPMAISIGMFNNFSEKENPVEITVIQPNIDPYNDKFGGMTVAEQMERILSLAKKKITTNTQYVVAPETAIPRGVVESRIEKSYGIQEIRKFLTEYPHIKFIIGASTYVEYPKSDKKPTLTSRPDKQTGGWFDAFNSALLVENGKPIQIYHKSKLVMGVERMPFSNLLGGLAVDLGGTSGGLGVEKEAKVLDGGANKIAPVICYESIYGDYVGDYINKGADLIFVITNDGWWEDTPGYKQHLSYARIRAIENRRSIARSANTGTSCFINQRGDISSATNWWVPDTISGKINSNSELTFYSQHGDYIGRIFAAISVIMLLWNWTIIIKKRVGSSLPE